MTVYKKQLREANAEVFVVPIITPNEHVGIIETLPARLCGEAATTKARLLTGPCFEFGKIPDYLVNLKQEARKRRCRVDAISWPDGTRCVIVFPDRHRSAPEWAAELAYDQARDCLEQVIFAHSVGGRA